MQTPRSIGPLTRTLNGSYRAVQHGDGLTGLGRGLPVGVRGRMSGVDSFRDTRRSMHRQVRSWALYVRISAEQFVAPHY